MHVYILNCEDTDEHFSALEISDFYEGSKALELFKSECKEHSLIYTLKEFEWACNNEELNLLNSWIWIGN